MSVRMLFHRYMGAAANNGYALFFEPGTSTAKTTYTSDYTTADSLNAAGGVEITSDGWLTTYLLGDYDMTVYTRTGVQIPSASALGINPQEGEISAAAGNLLANASFETDTDGDGIPDGWTITNQTGSTNELDSSDQQHGAKSMKFTSVGNGGGILLNDDFMDCTPLSDVRVTFNLKSTANVRNLVELIWYTAGQVQISTSSIYDDSATNPTSWAVRGGSATPPSTARYFKIRIHGCHTSDSSSGTVRFDNFNVKSDLSATGSFTGTLTGFTTTPTNTVSYARVGNLVTLRTLGNSATSNATTMTMTGMPANIRPTAAQQGIQLSVINSGTAADGLISVDVDGTISFFLGHSLSGAFTNSGTKGFLAFVISYMVDLSA